MAQSIIPKLIHFSPMCHSLILSWLNKSPKDGWSSCLASLYLHLPARDLSRLPAELLSLFCNKLKQSNRIQPEQTMILHQRPLSWLHFFLVHLSYSIHSSPFSTQFDQRRWKATILTESTISSSHITNLRKIFQEISSHVSRENKKQTSPCFKVSDNQPHGFCCLW